MAAVVKPVKKVVKGAKKVVGEAFEEIIEKPTKKIAAETFDVVAGTNKEERRFILGGGMPVTTPEVTPEIVPDDTMLGRGTRRTKGKRSSAGGTLMEGFGVAYAKPSSKSPTGGSS